MESIKLHFVLFSMLVSYCVNSQSRCDESMLRSILHSSDTKIATSRKDIPLTTLTKLDSILGFKLYAYDHNDSLYFPMSVDGIVFLRDKYIVIDYFDSGYIFWHWLVVCTLNEGIIQRFDLPVNIRTREEMINYMASHILRCHRSGISKKKRQKSF